jgi:hypothetical protein
MSNHLNQVTPTPGFIRPALKTPRAAAIAGIVFAVLFTISDVLFRLALPEDLSRSSTTAWLQINTSSISLALMLVPFAGIAFLWFVGVIRDRLGEFEDQFFATVFFGSGLLFLAMMFVSAAIIGGLLTSFAVMSDTLIQSGVVHFARSLVFTIMNIYAIRMAGVFMLSLGTIWLRTRMMPRPLVFLTYALALAMLLTINLSLWLILVFPAWVFMISVFILMVSLRREPA